MEISEELDQCSCGQDILEHCYIRSRLNGKHTYVDNVGINRFMAIKTGNLFDGLKRIAADETANTDKDVIEYARGNGFLFDKDYEFL